MKQHSRVVIKSHFVHRGREAIKLLLLGRYV